ncbi:MAG: holo-ACP synthase [Rhodoferax sp.]
MYSQNPRQDLSPHLIIGGRLGYDLVQISRIEESIKHFGDSFKQRFFTTGELNYAHLGEGLCAQRLAARFAAKEAVIKALRLSDAGVGWREIEVRKLQDGDCEIALHGRVAQLASAMGVAHVQVSMSHDGDYAGAMVSVQFAPDDTQPEFDSLS